MAVEDYLPFIKSYWAEKDRDNFMNSSWCESFISHVIYRIFNSLTLKGMWIQSTSSYPIIFRSILYYSLVYD